MTHLRNIQRAVPAFELRTSAGGESLALVGGVDGRMLEVFHEDGEFTLTFSGWHSHTEEDARVIELAKAITSDEQVVMTAYRGADQRLCQLSPPNEEAWIEFITKPFAFDVPDRFEVRSWSGRHDRSYRT